MRGKKAFTLVELLVVIAIIALLLSVLMPSLGAARNNARNIVCSSNQKQMGLMVAAYQSENSGAVPLMLNRMSSDIAAAKNAYLSLALRSYITDAKKLPATLDITKIWPHYGPEYAEYAKNYLPKYFVCPFAQKSGKADMKQVGTVKIGSKSFEHWQVTGYCDSYSPWMWAITKGPGSALAGFGNVLDVRPHPYGSDHGFAKYGTLPWHNGYENGYNNANAYWKYVKNCGQQKWDKADLSRVNIGSFADATVLYCEIGEYLVGALSGAGLANYKSHKKAGFGGTSVVFGDLHTGWVRGSQIGWP